MSDSLVLINTWLTGGEVEILRYADLMNGIKDEKQEETSEQVISRFNELRRKE